MQRIAHLFLFFFAFALSPPAKAQAGVAYEEGPVTAITYLRIEYEHFDEYVEWLRSTWKPLNEAKKQAGLIKDYKLYTKRFTKLDEANIIFMITYQNMADLDRRAEEEAIAIKMIGSTANQNAARIDRSAYRKNLGTEIVREMILK